MPGRPAAVQGKDEHRDIGSGANAGAGAAVSVAGERAAGSGDDLPQMSAQGTGEALCIRRGVGGRASSLSAWRTDPGPASGTRRALVEVDETQSVASRAQRRADPPG